jgi:phosphoribosylformylglycinamidine synthase
VQVGDPFEEKLLIEACLELLEAKLLVALGDCGAAGLTSSISEMASRGGVGVDIDASAVPQREDAMKAFEIMVSESQERMVAVVTPGDLEAAQAVCDKWGLRSTVIGAITDTGRFVVRMGDEVVADMPASTLAHDAPLYDPAMERPAYLDAVQAFDPVGSLEHPEGREALSATLLELLASPNICSRRWIWEQYDHQVMLNTVVLPGSDAAVLRIGDTGRGEMTTRGIAVSSDCNGRYCYLDPYTGAQIAFAEAARNVACSGGRPAAITDCLNFGNPEKPEVFWTFHESVRGLADACTAFGVPVISGNVSLYNESFGQAIYPTPTVGLVGVLDDIDYHCTMGFVAEGDAVVLLGRTKAELGGSEYLKVVHDMVAGRPPKIDLVDERLLVELLVTAIRTGIVRSAHDCSEGGLAVTLAESCIAGGVGARIDLRGELPGAVALFSESQGRAIVTVAPAHFDALKTLAATHATPCVRIGTVGGDRLVIGDHVDVSLGAMREVFETALERLVHPES